ncbi:MAG: IS3 family transposase [Clostridiaceae bacterium]
MEAAVFDYIDYYNNRRYQKRLDCMTPMEFRQQLISQAA